MKQNVKREKNKKSSSSLSLFVTVLPGPPRRRRQPLKVHLRPGHVGLDRLDSRLPSRRAHLAVLVGELERLHQAQGLVDGAADWEVVDGNLAQGSGRGDDEEAAEGDAGVVA